MGSWFLLFLLCGAPVGSQGKSESETAMMKGFDGWQVIPLFTVGERIPSLEKVFEEGHYQPVGLLDGIGAIHTRHNTIRVLINHELKRSDGYSYGLKNGTIMRGARISFVDVDRNTRRIGNSGIAYDSVFDRYGLPVHSGEQINQEGRGRDGFSRFCSATLVQGGTFGFADHVYVLGEEVGDPLYHAYGGSLWVLEVESRVLHGIAATGRMNVENIAPLDIAGDRIAMLIGDDTLPQTQAADHFGDEAERVTSPEHVVAAPLWLYIGSKNASVFEIRKALPPGILPANIDFLNRNGLLVGKLYYFVADEGRTSVADFKGTGSVLSGTWREVSVFNASKANMEGYDAFGYKNGFTLRREAKAGGAFQFSRPEDVSTHPMVGTRVAMASTGRDKVFNGHDSWGTIYQIDVDVDNLQGTLTILYDGDDAGGGQVDSPDHGIRSPDNLEWAQDGFVYIQEDNEKKIEPVFGSLSGEEASIWRLNPQNGKIQRIAQMDRSRVYPIGTSDQKGHLIGSWESSGILDVSHLFEARRGERWLLASIQAHTIQDGLIQQADLVEGGQLIFLHKE